MSGDVPGYSLSQQELNDLKAVGIEPAPPSNPGASARVLAAKYFADNPEPVQDGRLRTGSHADHRAKEVQAALVGAGLQNHADVTSVQRFVRSADTSAPVGVIAEQARVLHPEWFKRQTNTASRVLDARR